MSEVKKLLSLAVDELDIAKLLLERGYYRTCLSRSYYSMYYATKALLLSKDLDVSTHKGTIRLFSQYFVKTSQFSSVWSKILSDAYELRQLSDYDNENHKKCMMIAPNSRYKIGDVKYY
ncbi:HEPN domain-containing protein [Pseudanabaena sp. UWO311]|uniref:HEPN domain-containing protein n=1 Tax=Pseudanabaena sp. UWO311 TaxID=2487337 RepID=UPI001157ADD7|nr:HEPN domain-containing protein [Pseudanabaena sp. UWO311]TYQ25456.1 HEPN domain-containing protein [Pseudanabaena sp. UWO311]